MHGPKNDGPAWRGPKPTTVQPSLANNDVTYDVGITERDVGAGQVPQLNVDYHILSVAMSTCTALHR